MSRARAAGRSGRTSESGRGVSRRIADASSIEVAASNRRLTAGHLVEQDAEREDVGRGDPPVVRRAARATCRRVSHHHPDFRVPSRRDRHVRTIGGAQGLGEAEVQHLDATVGRQHDVGGLEVAMHDAFVMRGGERIGERGPYGENSLEREAALWDACGKRFVLDELHREEGDTVAPPRQE